MPPLRRKGILISKCEKPNQNERMKHLQLLLYYIKCVIQAVIMPGVSVSDQGLSVPNISTGEIRIDNVN